MLGIIRKDIENRTGGMIFCYSKPDMPPSWVPCATLVSASQEGFSEDGEGTEKGSYNDQEDGAAALREETKKSGAV